ncbi:S-layer homology domain-containing protein [Domibacillus sp.]|uniref:S-layer homology domain-containing protein n=1 Tax=Domibacillus sp. TaxID=1969783 RepID=UPI00281271EE|nr:S-layer homology domain-containing protein [Domibacillus sp.]
MKKNQIFLASAAVVTLTAAAVPAEAASTAFFTDVKEGNALYPEIKDLHSQGKINGFKDGTFRPQESVTRGQAAKMIADILELDTTSPKAPNLKDVKKEKWYYGAVAALVEAKIMGGFKDGTFRPDQTLTRAEASRLIGEAFKLSNGGKAVAFTDVKKEKWYYTYVQSLVHNQVTAGKTATTFEPDANVTRGELVAFAARAKKAVTPAEQAKTIESVQDGKITISGKTYTASESVKGLLQSTNSKALKGAEVEFKEENGVISSVSHLVLKAAGTESAPVVLDGNGAEIAGNVTVEGDNAELKNMTINGDLTVTAAVKTSFSTDKLTVKGTTSIQEEAVTKAASVTKAAAEDPKTRIKITFKDSSVAVIEIAKKDVYFSASGSTKVTSLSLYANADIFADEDVIIPKVDIKKGVTQIELNATIQDVVIDSNDDIQVSGKGNFSNVVVNTDKKVTLATTGAIKNLDMKNENATLNVGSNTKITNISVPEGQDVSKVVDNYNEVKDKIETVGGEKNPDYTLPVPVNPPSSDGGSTGPVVTPPSSGGGGTTDPVVTPPSSGGGSTGPVVTPPSSGGGGTADPVVTPPSSGDGGTTDPETDPVEETGDYFAAGILPVEEKYGYVTLNIKNQGNGKVMYQQVPESSSDFERPEEGDLVPAEAVEYKDVPFINWRDHDLIVYRVDSANKILDVVNVAEQYMPPFHFVYHNNGTVTVQALLKTNGQSVDEFMNYLYAYQDGIKKKLTDFSNVSWDNEPTGIPSFTVNLQGIEEQKAGLIFIGGGHWGSSSFTGDFYGNEGIFVQVLHDLARDNSEELWGHEFSEVLGYLAYEEVEYTGADGEKYTIHESVAEQDSLSMNTYKQRLIEQEAVLQTAAAIEEMVLSVNEELKDKVELLKTAQQKVESLYKEDRHDYPYEEQLREDITLAEITEARAVVEALSDEFTEKHNLTYEIDDAERLFWSDEINEYMNTLRVTVPTGLGAGADLTGLIPVEGKPDHLNVELRRTGQTVKTYEGYSEVEVTASYLKVEGDKLTLIRPNKTGQDITEYVSVDLKMGDRYLGNEIIPIVIQSSERDETALSNETGIKINWSDRSISEINTESALVSAYRGTTVEQLKKSLTASDYSAQSYVLKDAEGNVKTSGQVEEGDLLTVTAENGQASADYTLQLSIYVTELQEQGLGSFTFNADYTSVQELQEALFIRSESSQEERSIVVTKVEGTSNQYRATFENAQPNERYWLGSKEAALAFGEGSELIWRSYSINYASQSYPRHSLTLKEEYDTVDITSADEIAITFSRYNEETSEVITIDGVTIRPIVVEQADGSYKINFTSEGTDQGEIEYKSYEMTVTVDGIENKQVWIHVEENGEYNVQIEQ